ncbi:hypothetical protein DQ04_02001030 [Trypanosoma grayi]|uniref:hypothetical protein n=1 Tax=Trypanosoma grayi TaxID=71804 RepID=UPI0004F47929|nr:hypothetical protein DQ04_02001030 [Trypanosoma grayi]KEG12100.1 hypothetical protein DQ04_02001030 [Trypanosoma grayi]
MSEDHQGQLVTCLAWNNEGTNLAVGMPHGFIIYSTELLLADEGWLCEVLRRPVLGGVGIIALHGQSNVLVVAGWSVSHCATVTLLDLTVRDARGEELSVPARVTLSSPVEALRFHPRLVVIGEKSGCVHFFDHQLRKIESFRVSHKARQTRRAADTMALATMLVEQLASGMCFSLLHGVILGPTPGTVRCIRYVSEQRIKPNVMPHSLVGIMDEAPIQPLMEKTVELHHNEVQCIAITPDGVRALTVSERGTSLKLLDVEKGVVLCQFSRGTTPNTVHTLSLIVTSTDTVATCISDTGTLHLFHIPASGISGRQVTAAANTSETVVGSKLVRAWKDYIGSIGPKSRLSVPDDGLENDLSEQQTYSRTLYNVVLRPIAKKASCVAHLIQRDVSLTGVAMKARMLNIHVDLSAVAEGMMVTRSFYFPREEL